MPFVSKVNPRRPVTAVRPRPALTNFCNNRRQESVPFVSKVNPRWPATAGRPRPAATARSDGLLQQSAPGIRAVCFKSQSRRPVTARSDELLQQSAPGMRAVCFKSQSRRPVTAGRPRPALTNFCNNRRQECVPFVSKVNPGGPSRPAVHGPL